MNLRVTLFLVVACMVLSVAFQYLAQGRLRWFQVIEGRPFGGYTADFFTAVRVESGTHAIELRESGDRWELVRPVAFPADAAAVAELIRHLRSLSIRGTAGEVSDEFGLAEAALSVSWTDRHGATHLTRFGRDVQTEGFSYCYFQRGSTVYWCDSNSRDYFRDLRPDSLRDRSVCPVHPAAVGMLEVDGAGGRFAIVRDARGWFLRRPYEGRAAPEEVVHLLSILRAWTVEEFIEDAWDAGTDADGYGLRDPQFTVSVRDTEGDVVRLLIGRWTDEDQKSVFLARAGERSVFIVSGSPLSLLSRDASEYRDRGLFGIYTSLVSRMDIAGEEFSRVSFEDGGSATLYVGVSARAYPVDAPRLLQVVERTLDARLSEFLPKEDGKAQEYGLISPVLKIELVPLSGTKEVLYVGSAAAAGGDSRYVWNSRWEDYFGVATIPDLELLMSAPYSLRSEDVIEVAAENLKRFRLQPAGGRAETFVRATTWHREGYPTARLDQGDMARVIRALYQLRAGEWRSADGEVPGPRNCDLKIELLEARTGVEFTPQTLWVGLPLPNSSKDRWIRDGDRGWIFRYRCTERVEPVPFLVHFVGSLPR